MSVQYVFLNLKSCGIKKKKSRLHHSLFLRLSSIFDHSKDNTKFFKIYKVLHGQEFGPL